MSTSIHRSGCWRAIVACGVTLVAALLEGPPSPALAGSSPTVLYRINCGGPHVAPAGGLGPDWGADADSGPSPFSNHVEAGSLTNSTTSSINLGPMIPAGVPEVLFRFQRWDGINDDEMSWRFPVDPNTEVLVRLYFAEFFTGVTLPGHRVFDIDIEGGAATIEGLDVFAEVGSHAALMKWFIVDVGTDGILDIDFTHGAALNPMVAGIEVLAGDGLLEAAIDSSLQRAYLQLGVPPSAYPLNTMPDGTWYTTGPSNWTAGFFPGALWKCYSLSGDPSWLPAAQSWTEGMDGQQYITHHQDVGFMIFSSYGQGYLRTGWTDYRDVMLTAAGSMAQRYNPTVGCIRASGNKDATTGEYRVIIDGMTNLEILIWAAKNGGDPGWYDIAVSHAERSMADLIRPDGSSFQEVFYDTATGDVLRKGTFNGYATDSTWSRGQSWGVYGFTMMHRETGDTRFLDAARRMADFYIDNVPADQVPPWDFDAPGPNPPRDSSAAAVTAAGMLELGTLLGRPAERARYWQAGRDVLKSLCTDAYLSNGIESAGTLLHGTYNANFNQGVDASLIWGDYYLLDAIERVLEWGDSQDACKNSSNAWQDEPLSASGDLLRVRFTVWPEGEDVDGLIGLTDDGGATTAGFAALVRFEPSGEITAQDDDVFAAVTTLGYATAQPYRVELVVDAPAGVYSVYVAPPDGPEQLLALDFAFPGDPAAFGTLDTLSHRAEAGAPWVCDIEATAVGPADSDLDGDVDLHDLAHMQQCHNASVIGECACMDLDGSGVIDTGDWRLLVQQVTGPQATY